MINGLPIDICVRCWIHLFLKKIVNFIKNRMIEMDVCIMTTLKNHRLLAKVKKVVLPLLFDKVYRICHEVQLVKN